MRESIKKILIVFILTLAAFPSSLKATDFSSTNFTVKDPVIKAGGGLSTSTNYELSSSIGQEGIGSSSATNFGLRSGFLYFLSTLTVPQAPSGLSAAPASASQIDLSWTDNSTDESEFKIERKTGAGGTYSQITTASANATSYSNTGLSSNTTYFYRLRASNTAGNSDYSNEASATTQSGGGGGGGGGGSIVLTVVNFTGKAYPLSKITLLKDGQIAVTTIAGPDANFNISLSGLSTGNYIFSLFGEDNQERRSALFSFPVYITSGATANISGIFIAPTIGVDKAEVKRGDDVAIFGQSAPSSSITIAINSDEEIFLRTKAGKDGVYLYNFDTSILELGRHSAKSKSALEDIITSFSKAVGFTVGTRNVLAEEGRGVERGDLSGDQKVNLIDFSIAAYWYRRPLSEEFKKFEAQFLNGDGKIDLVDFSIMAYYWTG